MEVTASSPTAGPAARRADRVQTEPHLITFASMYCVLAAYRGRSPKEHRRSSLT